MPSFHQKQKEGLRIHIETDDIMKTQQLPGTIELFVFPKTCVISCRFCMCQI
jgi:pyruvate-formate lyase-activating enzyme